VLTIVIPYRGDSKRRLPAPIRAAAAVAMLGDVAAAALEVGRVVVVTDDAVVVPRGVDVVPDPGDGLSAAVVTHDYAAVIDKRFLSRHTLWHARGMARFVRKHPERLLAL
jgi:hypothetical protein